MHYREIIVDADLCNKLGASTKYPYLRILFPLLADSIVIHRVVYDEIMQSQSTKEQINGLIDEGLMSIVDKNVLSDVERQLYDSTWQLLASRMMNPKEPRKNKGEVSSLAFAKTRSIPIFATDEMDLQPIIDKVLNAGMDKISCLRVIHIVEQIKAGDFPSLGRREAKQIWIIAGKQKTVFDTDIWPI